jgi:hypothetical protein
LAVVETLRRVPGSSIEAGFSVVSIFCFKSSIFCPAASRMALAISWLIVITGDPSQGILWVAPGSERRRRSLSMIGRSSETGRGLETLLAISLSLTELWTWRMAAAPSFEISAVLLKPSPPRRNLIIGDASAYFCLSSASFSKGESGLSLPGASVRIMTILPLTSRFLKSS